MSDLFGVGGRQVPTHQCTTDARFHSAYGQRIESLVALIDAFTGEIDELTDSMPGCCVTTAVGDLNAAWTAVHKATVQQVVLTGDCIALAAHVAAGT